jgi:UDP-N-acetylmuramoyl-tripeptide--D-alanyl-D-alanine ligase
MIFEHHFDHVILCGKEMAFARETCPNSIYFKDNQAIIQWFIKNNLKESYFLIKGSRGMGLEKIVEFISG